MNRVCAALFGSTLIALATLGASAAATAVAPAGYSPRSPAGSEYREQLASAREIGARTSPSERHAAVPSLFGAGVTPSDHVRDSSARNGNATARARDRSDAVDTALAADASEHTAIAAAAHAPLDGPSPSLITSLLVVAALLATGLLVLLLRRQGAPG